MFKTIKEDLLNHLSSLFNLDTSTTQRIECHIQLQGDGAHGDLATNAALILAKQLKQAPREIAQKIATTFTHPLIKNIAIAGPGFINLTLTREAFAAYLDTVCKQEQKAFKPKINSPKKYNVEFISANPTGPLHIGHGRGGIIGDVLSNVLAFVGHKVTKEFYINDAGTQIAKLGQSLRIRCQQELGQDAHVPKDGYNGAYLITMAQNYIEKFGKNIADHQDQQLSEYAKKELLQNLKTNLKDYGITFDVWFSESSLHTSGQLKAALETLESKDLSYEQDGALWFRSTKFGDDKDRVLRKADGQYTYAASDIAYLRNKMDRSFDELVMVLGQDHHGYVARLKGGMQALGYDPDQLKAIIYQLVTLKESGELLRMSKRAGTMISLADIIDAVGADVARFFYLNRKAEAHLDFDVDLALKKSDENPVFYIQYAYVRTGSIIEKAHKNGLTIKDVADQAYLNEAEQLVIKKIAVLKEVLTNTARNFQTHNLTYYTLELAQLFHAYYAKQQVVDLDNPEASATRLQLMQALRSTLSLCMKLLGIDLPERM
ncbi:arginine--tRNA ligase [bacterium]|nr:arginine--tRNA ligase [bacterium]